MNTLSYRTQFLNKETVQKEWIVVDATNETLGRFSSRVALVLRGKHKPGYTPFVDCGDNVIVINAEKIRLTGKKMTEKVYIRHTGHPGGRRYSTPAELIERKPFAVIEMAVKKMLPKNRLGDKIMRNLHVYAGTEHPHDAQSPKEFNLKSVR